MLDYLKRFDGGIARGEAALATLFLISMILAASVQAVFRNLTGMELEWANPVLEQLTWVDPFLQKGTLWLAFLGASLATREGRHIGVDLLPRLAPAKMKLLLRGIAASGAAVVSFYLARAFWAAVLVNAGERPADFEVFGDVSAMHVCDATLERVTDAGLEMPTIFCGVRGALASLGVPIETPDAALQLIVPVMFIVMAVRLLANGTGAFIALGTGTIPKDEPPSHEAKRPEPEETEAEPEEDSARSEAEPASASKEEEE